MAGKSGMTHTLADAPAVVEGALSGSEATRSDPVTAPRASNADVEARLAEQHAQHEASQVALRAELDGRRERDVLMARLDAYGESFKGQSQENLEFRSQILDLREQVLTGQLGSKGEDGKVRDSAHYLGLAQAALKQRAEAIAEAGTDGADHLPSKTGSGTLASQMFDPVNLLAGVARQFADTKQRSELLSKGVDALDGTPEADMVKAFHQRLAETDLPVPPVGPKGLAIPVPREAMNLAAIPELGRQAYMELPYAAKGAAREEAVQEALAETSGTQIAHIRERTYRPDLLDPFRRPMLNWGWLGGGELMIDNDITMPINSAAPTAAYLGENVELTQSALTLSTRGTDPHRAGSRDDISWMTRFNDQLGLAALALQEMVASLMQLQELTCYFGSGMGNNPRGVWNVAGVNSATALTSTSRGEYETLLEEFSERCAKLNVNIGTAAYLMTWRLMNLWKSTLDFDNSLTGARLFRPAMGGTATEGAAPIEAGRGWFLDHRAAASTQAIEVATSAANLSGGSLHTILFGVFGRALKVSYSGMYIVIDEISDAAKGNTKMTAQQYDDVLVRTPQAFVRGVSAVN